MIPIKQFPVKYPCGTQVLRKRFVQGGQRWRVTKEWESGAALARNEDPNERPRRRVFIEAGTLVDPVLEPSQFELRFALEHDPVQVALRKLTAAERELLGLPEPKPPIPP